MTRICALLLGLVLLVAGCGGDDGDSKSGPAEGVFVGKVSGTKAYIAIVSDGDTVGGYVCDGKKVARWLKSPDGRKLEARKNGELLGEVSFDGDDATGKIEVAGARRSFSARRASGKAGLYRSVRRAKGSVVETGVVVLADGSFRGVRATMLADGSVRFATTTTISGSIVSPRDAGSIIAVLIG